MSESLGIGMRVFYLADDDPQLRRLSQADFTALHDTAVRDAPAIDKLAGVTTLRYIAVYLGTRNRRPVVTDRVECVVLKLDGRGAIDKTWWHQMTRDYLGSMDGAPAIARAEAADRAHTAPSVIGAARQFLERHQAALRQRLERTYRWQPSAALLSQVKEAIYGAPHTK